MTETNDPKVGDPVKVFGVLSEGAMHPNGGWDGEIVKVDVRAQAPMVTIRFNGKRRERFYVRGQGYGGKAALRLWWRTLEQANVEQRRNAAHRIIVESGFDLIRYPSASVELLEAAAKALRDIVAEHAKPKVDK